MNERQGRTPRLRRATAMESLSSASSGSRSQTYIALSGPAHHELGGYGLSSDPPVNSDSLELSTEGVISHHVSCDISADEGVVSGAIHHMRDTLAKADQYQHVNDAFSPPASPEPNIFAIPHHETLAPEHAPLKDATTSDGHGQKNIELLEALCRKEGVDEKVDVVTLLANQAQRRRKQIHDERLGLDAPVAFHNRAQRRHQNHLALGKDVSATELATGQPPRLPWSDIDEQKPSLYLLDENPFANHLSENLSPADVLKAYEEGYHGPNLMSFVHAKAVVEGDDESRAKFLYKKYLEDDDDDISLPPQFTYVERGYPEDGNSMHHASPSLREAFEVRVARAGPGTDTPTTAINVGSEEEATRSHKGKGAALPGRLTLQAAQNRRLNAERLQGDLINPFQGVNPILAASPVKPVEYPVSPTTPVKRHSALENLQQMSLLEANALATSLPPPKFPIRSSPKPAGSSRSSFINGGDVLTGSRDEEKAKVTLSESLNALQSDRNSSMRRYLGMNGTLMSKQEIPSATYVSSGVQTEDNIVDDAPSEKSDEDMFTLEGLHRALSSVWPDELPRGITNALPELVPYNWAAHGIPGLSTPGNNYVFTGSEPGPSSFSGLPQQAPIVQPGPGGKAPTGKNLRYITYLAEHLSTKQQELEDTYNEFLNVRSQFRNYREHVSSQTLNEMNNMTEELDHHRGKFAYLEERNALLEVLLKHVCGERLPASELEPLLRFAHEELNIHNIPDPVTSSGPSPSTVPRDQQNASNAGYGGPAFASARIRLDTQQALDLFMENRVLREQLQTTQLKMNAIEANWEAHFYEAVQEAVAAWTGTQQAEDRYHTLSAANHVSTSTTGEFSSYHTAPQQNSRVINHPLYDTDDDDASPPLSLMIEAEEPPESN
ncbi:hypothetical protein K432DRAFT_404685 [Lepidopterella palustris CBS 459.81]|uniref:Uncharacterized protein n=1 Tax=Lepidopterella palustris CBS 459.81 TaxID=1314670 RepID=A0A8E2JFD4_9PEZI|nr:hypothetical protein K432DRAFT_404685 [Lepidopterella palustris CBS 459.81]